MPTFVAEITLKREGFIRLFKSIAMLLGSRAVLLEGEGGNVEFLEFWMSAKVGLEEIILSFTILFIIKKDI